MARFYTQGSIVSTMKKPALLLCAVLLLGVAAANAEDAKIKGYIFGDYYAVLAADEAEGKLPAKGVHLMPNLVVALPDGLDPNIQGRLTFYYKF